jgi:hypothetical protein
MKKHFLYLLIFCYAPLSTYAQTTFAPLGAEWVFTPVMENTLPFNPLAQWVSIKSTNDSLIGGQTFRKVGHNLLFLQENEQVFLFFKDSLYLVFDFGVEVGDSLSLYVPINAGLAQVFEQTEMALWHFRVDSIELLPTTAQPLKKFYLRSTDPDWWGSTTFFEYVEKVGDLNWFFGQPVIHHSDVPSWLRCYRDSTLEFHTERLISLGTTDCFDSTTVVRQPYLPQITLAPNPISDQVTIDLGLQEISRLLVTDLSGRTVFYHSGPQTGQVQIESASWPRGMYLCYARSGSQWLQWKIVK